MDFEKEMKQSPEMQALVGKIMQAYSEYGLCGRRWAAKLCSIWWL